MPQMGSFNWDILYSEFLLLYVVIFINLNFSFVEDLLFFFFKCKGDLNYYLKF